MLSAVILADDRSVVEGELRARRVGRTLAALVAFVVADVVGDAQIVAHPGHGLEVIADRAGCAIAEDRDPHVAFAIALRNARRADVLMIRAGYAPERGFIEEIGMALDDGAGMMPALSLLRDAQSLPQRIVPRLAPVVGLVASHAALATPNIKTGSLGRLSRALSARPMRSRAVRLM